MGCLLSAYFAAPTLEQLGHGSAETLAEKLMTFFADLGQQPLVGDSADILGNT